MPGLPRAATISAIVLAVLGACSTAHHQNASHPDYGEAQYQSDLADCQSRNSTIVTSQGYDLQSHKATDEAKVATCMSGRGWQTAGH